MRPSQKLAIRASEIREKLSTFAEIDEELSTEQRAGLVKLRTEYQDVESKLTAAMISEDKPVEIRHAEGNEGAEMRALIGKCNVGNIFDCAVEKRSLSDGPELELQTHHGLATNQIPLELLETRAVSPAPGQVGQNQNEIIGYVFPQSCAAFLAVDTPTVATGDAVYPVLTSELDVHTPAENVSAAETTGGFTADVLSPGRIQASFFFSREDRARFAGMSEALRMNLSDALADKLDQVIIAGNPNGLLHGTVLANHAASSQTTYANYRAQFAYGRVDGKFASTVADVRAVVGSDTYAHMAKQFRSDNAGDRAAIEDLMSVTSGLKVSAHVPAASSNKQNAVIRLGMRRDYVSPLWEGISLIDDQITKAANGQILVTAVLLYAAKLIRAAGFYKQETQHA